MRKTILRRLEALEQEHRCREQQELDSSLDACVYLWRIVLAYYLGDLQSDANPSEAHARALRYSSDRDFSDALFKNDFPELNKRYNRAYRKLFAKVGLDFNATPPNVLFDAFVTMVNQLPDQWLNWLRSDLRQWCPHAEIPAGSDIPRALSGHNFLVRF
jgi:hypothetical protein